MSEANDTSRPEDDTVEMSDAAADMAEAMEAAADEMDAKAKEEELSLEERFQMLAAENADLKDKFVRAHAEMDNLRKRADRQVADARVYAIEKFAGDLLPVSDNFARALDALPEEERSGLSDAGKNLLVGVEAIQKELHSALARHGVTAIDAAPGSDFDPNMHQAVSQMPSEHPSGKVAATFQSGWKIGNRTLRAAMVAVSTGPAN
ncbi:nucleotide exchange factor GrpE [Ponticaulis profundi]|uniref:Protein GrpE n=1 Tax=Ponticaulis profundi TaxID=2665222 RepID=A0ABW1S8M8_9PROT